MAIYTRRIDRPGVYADSISDTGSFIFLKIYQLLWFALGLLESLLVLRMVLKFINANPASGFVSFIYRLTDPFALPFSGIVGTTNFQNSPIEWSTLIAMVVYYVVAYVIIKLLSIVLPTNTYVDDDDL
jgi:uncharacterized protein YggT (Ycf19 family)